ncbi:MAG TPA: hypothetical protein VGL94_02985 [Ktedonobacteraceae bacterium]|jgi:hypothetical protein
MSDTHARKRGPSELDSSSSGSSHDGRSKRSRDFAADPRYYSSHGGAGQLRQLDTRSRTSHSERLSPDVHFPPPPSDFDGPPSHILFPPPPSDVHLPSEILEDRHNNANSFKKAEVEALDRELKQKQLDLKQLIDQRDNNPRLNDGLIQFIEKIDKYLTDAEAYHILLGSKCDRIRGIIEEHSRDIIQLRREKFVKEMEKEGAEISRSSEAYPLDSVFQSAMASVTHPINSRLTEEIDEKETKIRKLERKLERGQEKKASAENDYKNLQIQLNYWRTQRQIYTSYQSELEGVASDTDHERPIASSSRVRLDTSTSDAYAPETREHDAPATDQHANQNDTTIYDHLIDRDNIRALYDQFKKAQDGSKLRTEYKHLYANIVVIKDYVKYRSKTSEEANTAFEYIKEAFDNELYSNDTRQMCKSFGFSFAQAMSIPEASGTDHGRPIASSSRVRLDTGTSDAHRPQPASDTVASGTDHERPIASSSRVRLDTGTSDAHRPEMHPHDVLATAQHADQDNTTIYDHLIYGEGYKDKLRALYDKFTQAEGGSKSKAEYEHLYTNMLVIKDYVKYRRKTSEDANTAFEYIKEAFDDGLYSNDTRQMCESFGFSFAQAMSTSHVPTLPDTNRQAASQVKP